MTDSGTTAHSLDRAWLAFGRRVAVAAGALAALVSLLFAAPLWVAAMRGTLALAAVLATVRVGRALLARSAHARNAVHVGEHAGRPGP